VPWPEWLDSAGLYTHLLGYTARGVADERHAAQRYVALVAAGRDVRLWDEALHQQIYLGDEAFVERMQAFVAANLNLVAASRRETGFSWFGFSSLT